MYQFRLSKISSTIEPASDLVAALALCTALVAIAAASILFVIAEQDLGPNATACDRLGIAAIAFGLWNGVKWVSGLWSDSQFEPQPTYTLSDIGLLLIAGVSFAASLALWAWSLTQTSVANSTLLDNMMPIFTTLGAWLLLGQRFEAKFLLGMVLAVGGVIAICLEDFQVAETSLIGDAVALLAAILSAACILSLEKLRVKFSTPIIMFWICLSGSFFTLPIVLFSEDRLLPTSWTGWSAVIALALVCQVVGQGLLTYSLKQFSSGLVAVSMLTIPVIAAVLALFIFAEQLSLLNWLAFLVVLAGIYLAISAQGVRKAAFSETLTPEP